MIGLASGVAGAGTICVLGIEKSCERVAAGSTGHNAGLFGGFCDRGIVGAGQVLVFQERREIFAALRRESGASGGACCTGRPV